MKKLLVLLLISVLAIFVFAGCSGIVPAEGEGEGEGEGEEITVELKYVDPADPDDTLVPSVKIGGIDYVAGEKGKIIVTFPAPVEDGIVVQADISDCTPTTAATKFLMSNEDNTVWTGNIDFACYSMYANPCDEDVCMEAPCCEAVITIISGACEVDECLVLPVVVDCAPPEVDLNVRFYDCGDPCDPCDETAGVYFEFTSDFGGDICEPDDCCADDCSGPGEWSFVADDICDPCILAEGTGCPVEGETNCECLPYPSEGTETYEVTFTFEDLVGNVSTAVLEVKIDTDEVVSVNGDPFIGFGEWIDFPVSGDCILVDTAS
jgi:hypothetical protein